MPDPTYEDYYRLLTAALLAAPERPFPLVNAVALARDALSVFVEKAIPNLAQAIESQYGVSVTVREIGSIVPLASGGDSVGDGGTTKEKGTLACLVRDANQVKHFLTCDHVAGVLAGQKINDPVVSPSQKDGGTTSRNTIGQYVKGGTVNTATGAQNRVDAALVSLANAKVHSATLPGIGAIQGANTQPAFGDGIKKLGAITSLTSGTYVYKVSHLLHYTSANVTALFVDQIGIDGTQPSGYLKFADLGDSGSLVVDQNNYAVGLLFAAAPQSLLGFANPIQDVLQVLGVALV